MSELQPPTHARPSTSAAAAVEEPVIIEGRNLWLAFGDNLVLEDISFQVREGDNLAIVGVSGVGKSTILKLILRLLVPDSGEVLIDREDINLFVYAETAQQIWDHIVSWWRDAGEEILA